MFNYTTFNANCQAYSVNNYLLYTSVDLLVSYLDVTKAIKVGTLTKNLFYKGMLILVEES
jgi:hypothetical protein